MILDVLRDRNTLYRDAGRQGIENNFTLRIINKHNQPHQYELSIRGIEGIAIQTPTTVAVDAESVYTLPTSVTVPHEYAVGGQTIEFVLEASDDPTIRVVEESRFRGPTGGN